MSTTKSLGERMRHKDILKFIQVHKWMGASNGCLATC